MNGILLINKEKGITSRDVVNTLSKKFNQKKIGHFGTLDPLATGLLVVGVGSYTKAQALFPSETKEYEVEVLLGKSTDTYDITGNVIKEEKVSVSKSLLLDTLKSFKKSYLQEVPIYSAVKVNGKKLYDYARNNEEVLLPKKKVDILDLKFNDLYKKDGNTYFSFSCLVSKGTYIRSLINDISLQLNIPMCMSNLKRTKCGFFSLEDACSLDDFSSFDFLTVRDFLDVTVMEIPDDLEKYIFNGSMIDKISDKYILFVKDGVDICLYGPFRDKMKPFLTFNKGDKNGI